MGTYSYPASGSGSVRPHAVSSITGTVNGVSNPSYTYDGNGNMTAGAGRSVSYTSFNMADTITQGSSSFAFSYDAEHARIKQVAPGLTTLYLNALGGMSEKATGGSTVTWRDYLTIDGRIAGERFCTGTSPCSSGAAWNYFVGDHLGSVVVATNASGNVTERDSFDAWGMRRNPNGTAAVCGAISSITTRGFTAQEEIDAACLVNMNARIYDPQIGRFMSADTIVPNPFDGQSFNRFSYVENNPLAFIDPSGHAGCVVDSTGACKPLPNGYVDGQSGMDNQGACWGCTGSLLGPDPSTPLDYGGLLDIGGGIAGSASGPGGIFGDGWAGSGGVSFGIGSLVRVDLGPGPGNGASYTDANGIETVPVVEQTAMMWESGVSFDSLGTDEGFSVQIWTRTELTPHTGFSFNWGPIRGHYPVGDSFAQRILETVGPPVPGQLRPDISSDFNVQPLSFDISQAQYNAMLNFVNENQNEDYQSLNMNCTDFVSEMLAAGGIYSPFDVTSQISVPSLGAPIQFLPSDLYFDLEYFSDNTGKSPG